MTKELMSPVEARSIRAQKPLHASDQVGPGRFDHQMKVVQHQTISMNLPACFVARFAEGFQKTLPILIVLENRFSPVPPVHDVIDRSRILHSQFARHAPKALSRGLSVKPIFYNSRDRPLVGLTPCRKEKQKAMGQLQEASMGGAQHRIGRTLRSFPSFGC